VSLAPPAKRLAQLAICVEVPEHTSVTFITPSDHVESHPWISHPAAGLMSLNAVAGPVYAFREDLGISHWRG